MVDGYECDHCANQLPDDRDAGAAQFFLRIRMPNKISIGMR